MCVYLGTAVQRMAQAHMQNLGICPPLEDPSEGDESEDHLWLGEEADETQEVLVPVPGERGWQRPSRSPYGVVTSLPDTLTY